MRGGSKPGERRGGRKKGSLNKTTLERQRLDALAERGMIFTPKHKAADKADQAKLIEIGKDRLVALVGDAAIDRMSMRDIMEWTARFFMKSGHYAEAAKVAAAAAPYGHARLTRVQMDATVRRSPGDFTDADLLAIAGPDGSEGGAEEAGGLAD